MSRAKDHPWLHGASREEGFPGGSDGKEPACNMGGQVQLIPGLKRSPREGNGNSLQYSFQENPMDGRD